MKKLEIGQLTTGEREEIIHSPRQWLEATAKEATKQFQALSKHFDTDERNSELFINYRNQMLEVVKALKAAEKALNKF